MLSSSNAKLGKIHNWSIPAITTCPGASSTCKALCYATKSFYLMDSVQKSHQKNLELSKTLSWVDDMISEIKRKKVKILRIHAAGDFYDVGYIRKWQRIVRSCPDTTFYAYTRSWDKPALLGDLVILANEPNFHMWWSSDKSMKVPPRFTGIRIAYLSVDDDDQPSYDVDLVFRDGWHKKSAKPLKRMGVNKALVCPHEQSITKKANITCERCKICFTTQRI